MRFSLSQRFSKSLFFIVLSILITIGILYLDKLTGWSPNSRIEFAKGVAAVVGVASSISTIIGFSPFLYKSAKGKAENFFVRRVIRNRLRALRIPMEVEGITNYDGTVALSFCSPQPGIIANGMRLDVVVKHSKEEWGTVEVVSDEEDAYLAIPFDRRNADFFESLEDRMKFDLSPPKGVVLVPTVPAEFEDFINKLLRQGGL